LIVEITAGRAVLPVGSKRYQFAPQIIVVTEDLTSLDFTVEQ
jgi:hypothetical protein